jgi:hypothetical protein
MVESPRYYALFCHAKPGRARHRGGETGITGSAGVTSGERGSQDKSVFRQRLRANKVWLFSVQPGEVWDNTLGVARTRFHFSPLFNRFVFWRTVAEREFGVTATPGRAACSNRVSGIISFRLLYFYRPSSCSFSSK